MNNIFGNMCLIYFLPYIFAIGFKNRNETAKVHDVTKLSWETWCKLQAIGYDCANGGMRNRFYYDIYLGDCKAAPMGIKCLHSINRFESLSECHEACQDYGEHDIVEELGPEVYCRLQPDFGGCNGYYPRFYFDMTYRRCRGFSYSGCGGNQNRFSSYQTCAALCVPAVEYLIEEKH